MNTTRTHPPDASRPTRDRIPWRTIMWVGWAILLILGAIGVWQRMTLGHLPAGYGSYVPWGLWIALYFHGVGMAGGVFVISAVGFVLKWPGFRDGRSLRLAIVLSVAAIVPAFIGVVLDLGHIDRAYRILTAPSLTSMMAFNAWMYFVYMGVAGVAWALSYRQYSVWLKPVLILGILLSTMFPSQSGAFFGVVDAREFWHSALLPILFFTSAMTAGAALLFVVRYLVNHTSPLDENAAALRMLRRITLGGLLLYFFFEFAEFSIALWNPIAEAPAVDLILRGRYWWVFWIVHVLIGGVVAAALLIRSRSPRAWLGGAAIIAVTFVSTRLNVLVPGQAVGEIEHLQEAFHHERLRYLYDATLMEYLVGLFLVALGAAVFYVGQAVSARVESMVESGVEP